jgi:LPS sulfotransferase NodH
MTTEMQWLQRLINWRDRLLPYLRNAALSAKLIPGHDDYARFIILGRSRSGSNMLRGLLNSHSQITVFGEIFQNEQSIGWALPGYQQSQRMHEVFRDEPVEFVNKYVFHRFPPRVKAVGFKIFYYHAQNARWKPVWQDLQADKDLKIIHIKRRNILKTHLSRKLAMLTDQWVVTAGEKLNAKSLELDYDELVQDFSQTRLWEEQADHFFSGHPKLEVIYEDLARDYTQVMKTVQSFLEVDAETLQPETHRQASQPLSESITNLKDLRQRFQGTPWASFFEEN